MVIIFDEGQWQVGREAAQGSSPAKHGWVRAAVVGGILAGIVSNVVLTLVRMAFLIEWQLFMDLILGPLRPDFWRTALPELWVPLKLFAYPLIGERSLAVGFDGRVVLLGVVIRLVYAICSGALFGLLVHRLSRIETVILGILCGIAFWAASSHFITPPLVQSFGRLVEFIPYGLALAATYLWYQRRSSAAHPGGRPRQPPTTVGKP